MKRKLNINWKYGRLVSICFVFAIEEFIVANFQVGNTMDVVVAVGGGEKAPKLMSHGVRVQIEITFVFHCHCESYNSICLCLPIRERCALFPFYCTSFTECVCVCARFSLFLLLSFALAASRAISVSLSLSHPFLSICFRELQKSTEYFQLDFNMRRNDKDGTHTCHFLFVCLYLVRLIQATKTHLIAERYKRKIISFSAKSMLFIYFLLVCSLFIRLFASLSVFLPHFISSDCRLSSSWTITEFQLFYAALSHDVLVAFVLCWRLSNGMSLHSRIVYRFCVWH